MVGFLNRINKTVEHNWDGYSREFPGFFFRDENGAKSMPKVIAAQTMMNLPDFPAYARAYVDQDPTAYYFMISGNPLAGEVDRDTAVRLFHKIFHDDLRMQSSFEDEGYDDMEAADMEVMPKALDKNYKTFFEKQMEALAKAMGIDPEAEAAEQAAAEKQARIDKLGFDPDDPDIIDIELDGDVARPVGQAAQKPGVVKADPNAGAVAMPRKIWYGVDLHIPVDNELGWNGDAGRLDGRGGGRGLLREEERTAHFLHDVKRIFWYIKNEFKGNPESVRKDVVAIGKIGPGKKFDSDQCVGFKVVSFDAGTLKLEPDPKAKRPTVEEFLMAIRDAGAAKASDVAEIVVDGWEAFAGVEPWPNTWPNDVNPRQLNFLFGGAANANGNRLPPRGNAPAGGELGDFLNEEEHMAEYLHNVEKTFWYFRRAFRYNQGLDTDTVAVGKIGPDKKFDSDQCVGFKVVSFDAGTLKLEPDSGAERPTIREFLIAIRDAGSKTGSDVAKIVVDGWGDFAGMEAWPNFWFGDDKHKPKQVNLLFNEVGRDALKPTNEDEQLDEDVPLSRSEMQDIADMFSAYSGFTTDPETHMQKKAYDWMQDHAAELRSLLKQPSTATGFGDFSKARDLGNDDVDESKKEEVSPELDAEIRKVLGEDAGADGAPEPAQDAQDAQDGFDEEEDILPESLIRKANMLAKEI